MSSITAIARSGLNSATLRLDASAHNIAIEPVDGAHRQLVTQRALADGGVAATTTQAPQAGPALADDVVEQRSAVYAFKANLRVLQTEQDMLGALLNVKA